MLIALIVLAISLLVIIHEFGHYLVARAFGMRVVTYSVGFGPVLARWRPRGSETVFQIAAIPMLAYVQIAGMNPREPVDPKDRGSYQNASSLGRLFTIAAGPLANYLAATVIILGVLLVGGQPAPTQVPIVSVVARDSPAAVAGLASGDRFLQINHRPVSLWTELITHTQQSRGAPMDLLIQRHGQALQLTVTPRWTSTVNPPRFVIGVTNQLQYVHVRVLDAVREAVIWPTLTAADNVRALARMIVGREQLQVMGPVRMVAETAHEAQNGWRSAMLAFASISLALFIFNLLPVPALDGGRLIFLLYEVITRRRPSPTFEARVTTVSMVLLLGLSAVVFVRDIWHLAGRG